MVYIGLDGWRATERISGYFTYFSQPMNLLDLFNYSGVLVAAGSAIGGMDAALLRLPREAEPKPAPEIVAALTAMGFGVYGARRAAMAVANRSVEVAVSWCFEHSGDSDFDTPID